MILFLKWHMCDKSPIFFQKYLVMSKKSSTFAVAFGNKGIYGGYSSAGRASDCGSECRGFEPH